MMQKKIHAAVKYGVDASIFERCWYEDPYLERCLKEGGARS